MSGFLTAYTANDLTSVRSGGVIRQFLAVHTPSIQLQFQPDANNTASSAAVITYTTAGTGAHTNVLLGMTVIISPSSDYAGDLLDTPEDCLVTYVRLAATSTTLSIAETSFAWTTGHTVTVLDDYRVFPRPVRTENGFTYFDYDQSPAGLKPRITGIQATVKTVAVGGTGSVSFAPSAVSMAGGSITTWAWDVDDGSFTSGSSSSQNVTVQFPIGSRYVHLTVTDSFGYTHYVAVPVWVIPVNHASNTVNAIESLRVSRALGMGASAECTVITGATWLEGCAAVVFSDVNFNNTAGAVHNIVDFAGWIASTSSRTRGDEAGVVRSVQIRLEDLTAQMQRIYVPELGADVIPNTRSGFSIAVLDGVWIVLSRLTTAANLASWDFFSNYTNYLTPRLNTIAGDAWQAVTGLSERCGAIVTTSTDGKQRIDLSLFYADSTTRNNATTIATLTTADAVDLDYQREVGNVVDSVELGCEAYNASATQLKFFRAISPAAAEGGAIVEYQDGVVLPKDQTDANNYINAGAYASYFFSASNFSGELRASLLGEWRDLIPSGYTWYKWSLTSTDFERGLTFDSNTRFLLTDVTLSQDNASGSMTVDVTFREEPDATANYAVMVESIPETDEEPEYPIGTQNPNLDLTDGLYQDNENDGWIDPTDPNAGNNRIKRKGMESFLVPFHSNATVSMTSDTVANKTYYVEVSNWTYVGNSGTWTITYDFLNGVKPSWDIIEAYYFNDPYTYPTQTDKWYRISTNGIQDVPQFSTGGAAALEFGIVWSRQTAVSYTVTGGTATYTRNGGSTSSTQINITRILKAISDDIAEAVEGEVLQWSPQSTTANGTQNTVTATTTESSTYGVGFYVSLISATYSPLYLEKLVVSGSGDAPPDARYSNLTRGDAFYEGWEDGVASAYSGSNGLQVNGSRPTLPGYDGSHVYRFTVTGTGSPLQFQFVDSDYTDNYPNFMRVTVWGPGID